MFPTTFPPCTYIRDCTQHRHAIAALRVIFKTWSAVIKLPRRHCRFEKEFHVITGERGTAARLAEVTKLDGLIK